MVYTFSKEEVSGEIPVVHWFGHHQKLGTHVCKKSLALCIQFTDCVTLHGG